MRWIKLRSFVTIFGGILILLNTKQCSPSIKVQTGLENLIANYNHKIAYKNIGIVTNHTGVNTEGTPIWELLGELPNVEVAAVFSPEHGLFGETAAGEKVNYSESDEEFPPLYSLYGPTRKPTKEMLKGIATGNGYQLGNELGTIEARPLNMTIEQAEDELRDLS